MINCAVIGYKNHAAKVIKILKKKCEIQFIYHPLKKIKNKNFTNNLRDLLRVDCIFIICPSKYHFHYLNFFYENSYSGYIFCEKIPVTSLKHLGILEKKINNKTYFNFNQRFSQIENYLNIKKFGKLLSLNIIDSKPYLSKKKLKINDWRLNSKDVLLTNNLIHYVDLIFFKLGKINNDFKVFSSKSNHKFILHDNINFNAKVKNILINIYMSYSAALDKRIVIYFEKSKIILSDKFIEIYFPTNKTNKNNFLIEGKLIKKFKINGIGKESNIKSINYFLKLVKNKSNVSKKESRINLLTTKFILNLGKKLFVNNK